MVLWGVLWGVVFGALWPGYGDWLSYVGGILGFFFGWTLRWVVRREIAATQPKPVVHAQPESVQSVRPNAENPALWQDMPESEPQPEPNPKVDSARPAPSEAKVFSAEASLTSSPEVQIVPIQPVEPGAMERLATAAKTWLLGGNTIVRVGLLILFIGLSFLARYAALSGLLPVEFRLAAIGAVGVALLVFGFRQRDAKPGFGLALQGAGIAVTYLTVFAAFRLYGLVPPGVAFALMIVVCGFSCALALLQNSRALAVAAFAGGFAVPVLLSTGQGSHVGLFSYYTVLNLAILFIAYRRNWRVLNLLGFLATFVVAGAWGGLKYSPQDYASTQPFLIGFVLIYVATAVLYARNTPTRLGNAVDSTLVFGTPLAGFGLQAGLVRHLELGAAFSALAFAAMYLLLAMVLVRRSRENYRLLIECFIALGVGFATVAVPLALGTRWTSALWALEGAAAFWVGMRQARWMPRAFGLLLQGVAAMVYLGNLYGNVSALPLLNPVFMGGLLIALPALCIAWWLRQPLAHSESNWAKTYAKIEGRLAAPLYLFAFGFWCLTLVLEIHRSVPGSELGLVKDVFSGSTQQLLTLLVLLASACASTVLALRTKWEVASWPGRVSLFVLAAALLFQIGDGHRVLQWPAWLIWPIAIAMHFWLLRQSDRGEQGAWPQKFNHFIHAAGVWLLVLLLADVLWFWIGKGELWRTAWASVVVLVSAIAVLMVLAVWAGRANKTDERPRFNWPLQPYAAAYYWTAAMPLAALVFAGSLGVALLSSGRTAPLPYIPLLNPIEIAMALSLGGLLFWRRAVQGAEPQPARADWITGTQARNALAGLAFVMINTVWVRIAHHFFGVDWNASTLFSSFVVQTGYAILWSLLALAMMLIAHRRLLRTLWLLGAALFGLVIVKLLLIDLSNAGGAERIIAFIAVGVLMLIVGYLAPLPPRSPVLEDMNAPLPKAGESL
jgi:uncharacterized membrane protein